MKIASLSTYPISSPFHGGQRRARALFDALTVEGHDVRHFPLFFGTDFPEASEEEKELALDSSKRNELVAAGKREDVHLSEIVDSENEVVQKLIRKLSDFEPDVIQFEQPWLFSVLKPILLQNDVLRKADLVYSSQNVEADLLPDAFKPTAMELERDLIAHSKLVIAVSTADALRFEKLGAKNTIVAPNGSYLPTKLDDSLVSPVAQEYALFIGSAHAPNAEGYWENFGMIPGFIPPSARLVVVGGVNNLLGSDPRFQKFRELNNGLIHNIGVVDEPMLEQFLGFAAVICLPIASGGGTNLKTAEALLSGKPIIAMSAAFRGFEKFKSVPNVFVAESTADFRSLIQRFFRKQLDVSTTREPDMSLTWQGTLEPLVKKYGAGL